MGDTVTNYDMQSRRRIVDLESRVSEALDFMAKETPFTYWELVVALSRCCERWASHGWRDEVKEANGEPATG